MDMKSALVLLSGGQDSTTCLAWAVDRFDPIHTISFNYGQRHQAELSAALRISERAGRGSHREIDLRPLFGQVTKSDLIGVGGQADIAAKSDYDENLPASFVPGRNIFFLTTAGTIAAREGIGNIVTGVCQTDYSGYPDCRAGFVKAMNTTLIQGLDKGLEIHTPMMWLTKAETVYLMRDLGHISWLQDSHTCYEGTFPPCRVCSACVLRAKGFQEADTHDPLIMRAIAEGSLPHDANSFGLA